MSSERLTARQRDVLGVVAGSSEPLTASYIGEYHLPIGASSARSALRALEAKGLVAAQYTGHGSLGRAFVATRKGADLVIDEDEEN